MDPWDSDPNWAQRQGVKQAWGLALLWVTAAVVVFLLATVR